MGGDTLLFEILILGAVVLALVMKLRAELTKRHDEADRRPTPLSVTPAERAPGPDPAAKALDPRGPDETRARRNPWARPGGGEETDEGQGIEAVRRAERGFNPEVFAQGAQRAFETIVRAFAGGDREALRPLLAAPLFELFSAEIAARAGRGETHEAAVHRVLTADIVDARVEGGRSWVTMRFNSEQSLVVRDHDGVVQPEQSFEREELRDIWVFSRPTRSNDPNWVLTETRDSE